MQAHKEEGAKLC